MTSDDVGPKPEPLIEPSEPNPGGVDAIDGGDESEPTIPDLSPESNPAVDDAAPDQMTEGEDTSTQATENEDDPIEPEKESPA